MKKFILIAFVSAFFSVHVYADYDAALEAREAAQRKAEQQKAAAQKAKTDKMLSDANMQMMREQLGKEAVGKSDAEVKTLHKARMAAYQKEGQAAIASGKAMEREVRDNDARAGRDSQVKSVTGKSIAELEKMSDKDLDALSREMERKYGK
ncbi:MAG: hypothetical protein ABL931_08735 [Usitatibacteraceae bacterium]